MLKAKTKEKEEAKIQKEQKKNHNSRNELPAQWNGNGTQRANGRKKSIISLA